MAMENEYEDFANKCYDDGKDLGEEMKKEIARIIEEYKVLDVDLDHQAEKIMRLIYATKYEW